MAKKKRHHEAELRHRSMESAGMISEDKGQVANLPQHVVNKPWPRAHAGFGGEYNDNISGIDQQIDQDEAGARRHKAPKKW